MYPRSGFATGEHPNVPSRSGFWYQGTSAKTNLLETTLLRTPDDRMENIFESLEIPLEVVLSEPAEDSFTVLARIWS